MPSRKYPGRDRVIARDDARDVKFRDLQQEWSGTAAKHPCSAPWHIHAIGLPSVLRQAEKPLPVEIQARCRKCPQCLAHRRRLWTARAVDEIKASNRTWFGTMTVAPAHRFRLRMKAEIVCHRQRNEPFSELSASDQFRMIAAELNREANLFLDRVRKMGEPHRYLLVTEAHKSGDPHLHILLHEPKGEIRKTLIEQKWRLGFSHWRLVDRDPKAAVYVCKYLAKDALTRVRASKSYGQSTLVDCYTERMEQCATRFASMP